jgi:hypothetical protein
MWELREEKKIAGGGGDCKPKKQQGRGGDGLVSARRKKLGLGFFMVALNFSLLKKFVLCKFFPLLCIWLDVHLYRKSLYVLFKEIL